MPKIGGKEGENRIKIILTLNIIQLFLPSRQQSNKSSRDIYSRYFISTDNVTGEVKFFPSLPYEMVRLILPLEIAEPSSRSSRDFNFRSFTRCLSRKATSIVESASPSFQKHLFALERIGLRQELGHNRMILETMLDGTRPSVTGSKETRILNHARISLYPPPPYCISPSIFPPSSLSSYRRRRRRRRKRNP